MTGPPAAQAALQEARGGSPGANPRWALIVNPVLNESPVLRRKDAERLVSTRRAEWVSLDPKNLQLRLVLGHPANQSAARAAAAGYNAVRRNFKWFAGLSGGAAVMKTETRQREQGQ